MIIDEISISIKELIDTFLRLPDVLLTEEDVRCYLYSIFLRNKILGALHKTNDDSQSISIHTEVRWYGYEENKLLYRSDLVILDPTDLQVKDDKPFEINSKGFGFDNYYAVIEIKLRRIIGHSNANFISEINDDLVKLEDIRTKVDISKHKTVFYSLNFDKKPSIRNIQEELNGFKDINFFYIPAKGAVQNLTNNEQVLHI